ncbi:MAG TPA: methanogenesis marker 9 domain-containing protein [Methanosarcinaceae archaeon]|nr:methanogenesis marker 9 domain-containing protein [Methanosarcinaceae archaeon]
MTDDLFDLHTGYVTFKNPIALATMAGITDSAFANEHADRAGLVIIGSFNLDEKTNDAASKLIARDRNEFISDDPFEFLKNEIEGVQSDSVVAVNVRSTTIEPLLKAAKIVKDVGAILELDAHCRQEEMVDIGVGEALMHDIPRLVDWIGKIKQTGVVLSIKIRANVVNDIDLARAIESAGADILHVDAMGEVLSADLRAIRHIRDSTNIFLIGNNSITCFKDAKDMLARGADMISVARGVLNDSNSDLISELVDNITAFQEAEGWYNAPKHICGGEGDLRALAFCCLPVKSCAVHNKIGKLGFSAQEFANLKMEFAKGTLLEYGDSTCFGSLIWCCKLSKPCFLRDGVLDMIGLSGAEYMRLKKDLSIYILENAKIPVNEIKNK